MGKKEKTEELQLQTLVTKKVAFDILETVDHERCKHVETVFITEDGKYHLYAGNEHFKTEPTKDEKTGKTGFRKVKLPGLYIGNSKVIADFSREEVLDIAEEIKTAYEKELQEQDAIADKKALKRPSAGARLIREALKQVE